MMSAPFEYSHAEDDRKQKFVESMMLDQEYKSLQAEQKKYSEILEEKRMKSLMRFGYFITIGIPSILCVATIPITPSHIYC